MSAVAIDVVGEGGVQFKTYMPLFILFVAVGIAGTAYLKVRRSFR
jgi:hypothetical protein